MKNFFKYKRFGRIKLPIIYVASVGISSCFFGYWLIKSKMDNTLVASPSYPDLSSEDDLNSKGWFTAESQKCPPLKRSCSCHFHKPTNQVVYNAKYEHLVPRLFQILNQAKEEYGCPGISFGILQNGQVLIKGGIGYSDVENGVKSTSESIYRIASISKSLTSVAVGRLIEEGRLDIDECVQTYIPDYPEHKFNDEPVQITVRHLLSHTSGIRGYFDGDGFKDDKNNLKAQLKRSIELNKYGCPPLNSDENYFKEHYRTVSDGLNLFKKDPLIYRPGEDMEYSSVAYSVISRIIEKSSGLDYVTYMKRICKGLSMLNTDVDMNDTVTYERTRNYTRDKKHVLLNAAFVDNSYKWSGGGFLSNVDDLLKFGDNLLNSYHYGTGFLHRQTVKKLWQLYPVTLGKMSPKESDVGYALGWTVKQKTDNEPFTVYHTGGAVGASSVLMLFPRDDDKLPNHAEDNTPNASPAVDSIVIVILVNMQSVGLTKTARKLHNAILNDHK